MTTIVIAERDELAAGQLVSTLSGLPDTSIMRVGNVSEAYEACVANNADVLVVGPSHASAAAFEVAAKLRLDLHVATVAIAASPDTELMRQAMRSGVGDVLASASPRPDIVEAVAEAAVRSRRDRAAAGGGAVLVEDGAGHVVTVFSTKGGVGKSVLSTNLAVSLAHDFGKRVVIVDVDLQFGDVGIMLGIPPAHSLYDAAQAFDRLDASMLQGLLSDHESGLRALLAPVRPEDAEAVTSNRLAGIIRLLRRLADYVVIDTAPAFTDVTLSVLDHSDLVYMITMMDVASIKNTRISLQKLQQLGYDPKMMRLVLNRADSKVLLEDAEVQKAIGGPISARIPSDLLVPRSVNKGVPIVMDAPRSRVAKSITAIAADIVQTCEKQGDSNVA